MTIVRKRRKRSGSERGDWRKPPGVPDTTGSSAVGEQPAFSDPVELASALAVIDEREIYCSVVFTFNSMVVSIFASEQGCVQRNRTGFQ